MAILTLSELSCRNCSCASLSSATLSHHFLFIAPSNSNGSEPCPELADGRASRSLRRHIDGVSFRKPLYLAESAGPDLAEVARLHWLAQRDPAATPAHRPYYGR